MYVTPPMQSTSQAAAKPAWLIIGPGFAALIGLFLLTAIYQFGGRSAIQLDLGLSRQSLLLSGVVAYLVALLLALPLGLLLGGRYPTAVSVPAICLMLLGVLAVAFTPNGFLLSVGRVLGGLGAGAVIGGTVALIRGLRAGRGVAAGVAAGLGVLSLVIAPFLGELVSDVLNFRVVYLAAAVAVFFALVAASVTGIVTLVSAKPPVPQMPYGMPYPPQNPSPYSPEGPPSV
ncbi:multidrug transporter [Amycolatopsis benzoatilytica]|uniref:multidrug transporter n=1 Tax=Amycolatopsis benzoatilytica TaxID=346045 RepID=UPI0003A590E5|nr:multidrug transporter [Amycolatopsis benzoatilytica]